MLKRTLVVGLIVGSLLPIVQVSSAHADTKLQIACGAGYYDIIDGVAQHGNLCDGPLTIDSSATSIAYNGFRDALITELVIPDSVESIGAWAFYLNLNLETVTIGSGVHNIGAHAFNSNHQLTHITFLDPTSLQSLGEQTFASTTSLSSISLPEGLTALPRSLFHSSGLTSITIPASVTLISYEVFSDSQIGTFDIPATVTSIDAETFPQYPNVNDVLIHLTSGRYYEYLFLACINLGGCDNFGENKFYAITSGNLPPGLDFDATTGLISGTPTANGTFSPTFEVTWGDGSTKQVESHYTFNVTGVPEDPAVPTSEVPDLTHVGVGDASAVLGPDFTLGTSTGSTEIGASSENDGQIAAQSKTGIQAIGSVINYTTFHFVPITLATPISLTVTPSASNGDYAFTLQWRDVNSGKNNYLFSIHDNNLETTVEYKAAVTNTFQSGGQSFKRYNFSIFYTSSSPSTLYRILPDHTYTFKMKYIVSAVPGSSAITGYSNSDWSNSISADSFPVPGISSISSDQIGIDGNLVLTGDGLGESYLRARYLRFICSDCSDDFIALNGSSVDVSLENDMEQGENPNDILFPTYQYFVEDLAPFLDHRFEFGFVAANTYYPSGLQVTFLSTLAPTPTPSITPSTQSISGVATSAITPTTAYTPVNLTSPVYTVSPALPAGLVISATTGVISGTPTSTSASTSYVVTATSGAQSATATVTLVVTAAPTPTPSITPSTQSISGVATSAITPTTAYTPVNLTSPVYTVSPALPAGLVISATTGVISGTPTSTSASTSYVVTATSGAQSATSTVTLVVTAAPTPTPVIYIPPPPQSYLQINFAPVLHKVGDNVVCSNGSFNFGVNYFDGTPNTLIKNANISTLIYKFFIDGVEQKALQATTSEQKVSIAISGFATPGLLTCQVIASRGGVTLGASSTLNTAGVAEASSLKISQEEKANLAYQSAMSANSQAKSSALVANRALWRSNVALAQSNYAAFRSKILEPASKSNSSDPKSIAAARVQATKKKVVAAKALSTAVASAAANYKEGILVIASDFIKQNTAALGIRDMAIAKAENDYRSSQELAGYGVYKS